MKYTKFKLVLLCLSIGVVSGCQQNPPVKKATPEKVNQLAALIASTEWLRDHCQRSDIPLRTVVEEKTIMMAKQRGWEIPALSTQELKSAVEQRYLAISEDNQLINDKCAQLNQAAAPFIQQITLT